MNYQFPRIVHIQQVFDAIKGDEEYFYVVDKGAYTVINYKLPCNKTFPAVTDTKTAIRRELRGIKFNNNSGEIIARVLPKFFNYGEREETLPENIDLSIGYDRLEKLDGSMIHPMFLDGGIRFATKMGVTDTSMQVETWFAKNNPQGLKDFIWYSKALKFTPIFEWCSRKNRIVVDHPTDRLVLLAIRELYSGEYIDYESMKAFGQSFDFEIVKKDSRSFEDIKKYAESIHDTNDDELTEGEVLRFHNGHSLKIKTKAYVNLHKTKDKIQKERNFVAVLLSGNLDDLKPFMLKDDIEKASAYEEQLNQNIRNLCSSILKEMNEIKTNNVSRKDFALNSTVPTLAKQIIFNLWDSDYNFDVIYADVMRKLTDACEHEQKFERLKDILLKDCTW